MSVNVIEKLRAVAERRAREESTRPQRSQDPAEPDVYPTLSGRNDPYAEPLSAAVELFLPELDRPVWLVPSRDLAKRLGLERGACVTPEDLMILETLDPADRITVLRYMQATGFPAAMAPARLGNAMPRRRSERQS